MIPPLMRSRGRVRIAVSAAWLLWTALGALASAEERSPGLQLSAGVFNFSKSETELEAGVELRLPSPFWKLDGTAGLTVAEEGGIWLYFGLRRDFRLSERWVVAPGFGFSHYAAGDSKELGGPLEFRSAIDIGYRLTPRKRLGLTLYHLSNAGYYDLNPGSNSLVVTYSFDFR